jgi:hypothetical protein
MIPKIFKYPFFLFLFSVFFVLHGFTENFYFVPINSALLLTAVYIITSLLLTVLFYLFSKKLLVAAIMATVIMFFHFFFGPIHDSIKELAGHSIFSKYSFILPMFLLIVSVLYVVFKNRKDLTVFTSYLNILLLVLILVDAFLLFQKTRENNIVDAPISKNSCDSCSKPDIYIILLDGYPGEEQLMNGLHYDNSALKDQLSARGFKTMSHTHSNYLFTPYSVASILNMQYVDSTKVNGSREKGVPWAFKWINKNRVISFMKSIGYEFYNYSIFQVAGQAAPTGNAFVSANTKLITGNTFLARLKKDVIFNIATKFNWKAYLSTSLYQANRDNNKLYDLILKNVKTAQIKPKVVLTHFLMPHDPYYFDENGKLLDYDVLSKIGLANNDAFLSNVKHTNKKAISLVDSLIANSPTPPVIILLSDHGYRYDFKSPLNYAYKNFFSVYFPDKNYEGFSDSMIAVNFFPAILNNRFGQQIPMHADSTFTFGYK